MSSIPNEEEAVANSFSFHHLQEATFPGRSELTEQLMKWNIDANSQMIKFRFDQQFSAFNAEQFARDFFSDPTVQTHLQVATKHGMTRGPGTPTAVKLQQLSTTVTNLDFFDVLQDEALPGGAIVREDGKIGGCFEEWEEGVCCQDRLRLAMCKRDSEEWDCIPEHMRKELLFGVFRHLSLGGSMCQWEDQLEPYTQATKLMYKDMVKARKNADSGQIEITTLAYQIHKVEGCSDLFPSPYAPNNFCLMLVDPVQRHVTYYYHGFIGFM